MSITWRIPGEQPDPVAIRRMRQHFPKPDELMPVAWFMGEIAFYESLAMESPQALEAREICDALNDIAGGIFCFPKVKYVPIWIAWFKYLLPDLLLRANEPENLDDYNLWILVKTITAVFNVYPRQITDDYPGFRNDLVSLLGTRAIPPKLARERTDPGDESSPLFTDIWDRSYTIENYGLGSLVEIDSLILFCIKYLTVAEINDWAASLFQIDGPQWHLQLIFSLKEWRRFLNLASNWNQNEEHFLRRILKESEMLAQYWTPHFKSLAEFLPTPNIEAFEQSVSAGFSFDLFHAWTDEIWTTLDAAPYNIKNMRYLNHYLAEDLRNCEAILFPKGRSHLVKMAYDDI